MYASKPSAPQNYYDAPPAQPPPPQFGQATFIGVPVNAPSQYHHHANTQSTPLTRAPGPWSSGLFGCFDDIPNCCITWWCPCITFGQIAEITDKGATSCGTSGALYALIVWFIGCACMYSCFYRSKIREQYALGESPCGDCCVHFFCETCALCQEYRELKYQGFDMSIGWQGNVARPTRGVEMAATAPPFQGGMSR